MTNPDQPKIKEHYHLAGVAGTGMSALAELLARLGYSVSGSDRYYDQGRPLAILEELSRAGVKIVPQDGKALTANTRGLIVSTAIENDNPEKLAAQKLGIPIIHRATMLAKLAEGKDIIAIAGTSGKTTVTGIIGWLLTTAGLDPTVVNGGTVLGWEKADSVGNIRIGKSNLWVVEVDESDRSFLQFHPQRAIITNISADHFSLPETTELFRKFAAQVNGEIICGPGVAGLLAQGKAHLIEENPQISLTPEGWTFGSGGKTWTVPLLGRHNAENAWLATLCCRQLGIAEEKIRAGLASFQGISRRLEKVGTTGRGIQIFDDYAHNPAKIQAAWTAVATLTPRVLGIWRPHGYGPLATMFSELVGAFSTTVRSTDHLFVLPVYYAGGTTKRATSSEEFVAALQQKGVPASFVPDYPTLLAALKDATTDKSAVLLMGARDPDLPLFARSLVGKL